MKIFVFAGSGLVSGLVIESLLEKGHVVYAGTRNPDSGKKAQNLHWVKADASQPNLGLEVLDQVDRAFFLCPPGYTDQFSVLNPWIEKAKSKKLQKVVLMTAIGIDHSPEDLPFRKLEISLENSGLAYNIVRPNWFMQNFQTFWISGILKDKKIYFPGGNAKTSFIDARDIASSAVTLLLNDSSNGKGFTLTGKESITHEEVAQKLSKATGLNVAYADITPEDFKKGLVGAGVPEDYANVLVYIAGALKDGHAAPVSNAVKEITGKDPIPFDQYANDNKKAWLN
ncbi:NmrA family NAD(P)-binding protein [Leptospira stimsonii]|uniref:Nucleoside-diphosphate sugar epimerase n=1 Tax=Leptospira stimsonii TaxID=2202203 RepID=A0A4R9KZE7_9LEPT|nr:NmrA family NAD(P)-binding protein [Leptospira stimsonii]RHX88212.1 nucleoside-diphosphate sugar epimerase [Leptospira stimsonii]TGK23910.1 nucleoside-diphosphate sugar epimerase [Leptospira stimsonii]TGM10382.1 nucleoside-diphosphate sugar epimerase [Leptospira stimsonii]